jgi:ribose 5-phosphate isomerase A
MGDIVASVGVRERAMQAAAAAALDFVEPGSVIGVGTGRTAAAFVAALAASDRRPAAAVASSLATADLLRGAGIDVVPLPASGRLPLYVDGADFVDGGLRLLKGAGGAHAREKVLASASDLFVCIVDDSKCAAALAGHALPVEALDVALSYVTRELAALGAQVLLRDGTTTDNGNPVLDADGLDLSDPEAMECRIECIPGVVACGLFAHRRADVLVVGHADGSVTERRR